MISAIVTTNGKRNELFKRFVNSLCNQTVKDFELIVVDQAESDEIPKIMESFQIRYNIYRTNKPVSLSRARNIGLKNAQGEIVCFPDDDCWYPNSLIESVIKIFEQNRRIDCICGCAYDPDKQRALSSRSTNKKIVRIKSNNAFKYPISIGIFSKRFSDMFFDEELGVGTKYGSGEETDYILNLINKKKNVYYFKDILIYHPYNILNSSDDLKKCFNYGIGYGVTVKKALKRKQYGVIFDLLITISRTIAGVFYHINSKNKIQYIYINRINGIIKGLLFS